MPFLICDKHHKVQRSGSAAVTTARMCMSSNCPNSMRVMCERCEEDHLTHSNHVLTIEDASFLLDRLLKLPSRELGKPIGEALDVIKQLKLIKDFRRKIDALEKELQKEALLLIDQTEQLIQEYAQCKQNANKLAAIFSTIEETATYRQFYEESRQLLSSLEYNAKKDKLEFASAAIKQKDEARSLTFASAREKIEEVRDYSMKIIEVILSNEDSDSEEEDLADKRRHYEALKQEICRENSQEQEMGSRIKDDSLDVSNSTLSRFLSQKEIQTQSALFTPEEMNSRVEEQVAELRMSHLRSENDFKLKLHAVVREKENIHREFTRWRESLEEKKKAIAQLQAQLREGKGSRVEKAKMREDLMNKIIEIWSRSEEHRQ